MSYDILVFDPETAPRIRGEFLEWYSRVMEGDGDRDGDPGPELSAWYEEMRSSFPALNGPYASEEVEDPRATDYGVGGSHIYACFPWSQVQTAHETTMRLAAKHGLGVFEVSSADGVVWLPTSEGPLALASRS